MTRLVHKPLIRRAWLPLSWKSANSPVGEYRWLVTDHDLQRRYGYYRDFPTWRDALRWSLARLTPCPSCGNEASSITKHGAIIHNGCPGAPRGIA